MSETNNKKFSMVFWRRLSQGLFLLVFLVLFRKTEYAGVDEIPWAVNVFFRFDPLAGAAAMLASRTVISLLFPGFLVLALTLVLGRFFCGWVCPLGTLLDVSHGLLPPRAKAPARNYRAWKYYALILVLVAALFGLPLVGFLDPFSLLTRGLTLAVDPALFLAVSAPSNFIYKHASWATPATEPVYSFLKSHALPFLHTGYDLALLSLLILLTIFLLERIERRFWCRNLCPLGGLFALGSRSALLRLHPGVACRDCQTCREVCRMGAINEKGRVSPESCTLCLDCLRDCPRDLLSFRFKRPKPRPAGLDLSRRGFVSTLAAGVALPAFFKTRAFLRRPHPYLIRPPGALAEPQFLSRCVRCGECMKVCLTNGLQPVFLEGGAEAMFSPVLVPKLGYCEYNCTLCGQVCPSGAITQLARGDKQKVVIGRAVFDKNLCLPWAKGKPCLVCEEHCPTPDKAIKLREATVKDQEGNEVTLKQPFLVDRLCIGCGICENKCPLQGEAAVRVTSEAESRNPETLQDVIEG